MTQQPAALRPHSAQLHQLGRSACGAVAGPPDLLTLVAFQLLDLLVKQLQPLLLALQLLHPSRRQGPALSIHQRPHRQAAQTFDANAQQLQ